MAVNLYINVGISKSFKWLTQMIDINITREEKYPIVQIADTKESVVTVVPMYVLICILMFNI